ncbi:stalk domain-containing protein [Brevibacillus fluminis]|nr:stalk domain-containing protein [Brevibacillus fluminis]
MKKRMWKKAMLVLCSLVFLGSAPISPASAQAKTTIMLDGYPLSFPIEPTNIKGYNMVPFRAIAEAIGITVQWDGATSTITASKQTSQKATTVVLQLNNPVATVNGVPVQLPVSPVEQKGYTLVPLSFFSQQFGANVNWNGATRTVTIASPQEELYTMGFYAISSFAERTLIPSFDSMAFGWSRIDADGNVTVSGKDFYWPQAAGDTTPEGIIDTAAAQGTAPFLMVYAGDAAGELTKLLETKDLRDRAIHNIGKLVEEKRFTGVVLDFEGLGMNDDNPKVKQKYNEFVSQLAAELHPRGIQLALALHPQNGAFKGYDYATLGKIADLIVVMAYAYENEKQPEPLNRVNEAIKLAIGQVPKDKLLLGISMGSENAQSVNSKIGLAKRYGLKGIALWRLGLIGQPAMAEMQKSVQWKGAVHVNQ